MGGKVALITGGASGISDAMAEILFSRGWRVVIVDLNTEPVSDRSAHCPEDMFLNQPDVRGPDAVNLSCKSDVERWGRLNLLVNCAGTNRHSPREDISLEDWSFVVDEAGRSYGYSIN